MISKRTFILAFTAASLTVGATAYASVPMHDISLAKRIDGSMVQSPVISSETNIREASMRPKPGPCPYKGCPKPKPWR
jgi:hypothetical protein